ncbi:MAG TPA: N-acyl homoserine lactonase family protein [Rhodocyclaceae bacterium]|nr:N-acyl homoserine lactonase family protein [Rhodocyclaceae bacterium]
MNDLLPWQIDAIDLARRTAHRSWFYYLSEDNGQQEISYRAWLLRRGQECILVDTGPPLEEAQRRGLRDVVSLDVALRRLGVEPRQVNDVVLTHLHWDHAASADLFIHARFHVQRSEIEFFRGQAHDHPATARFFSHRQMLSDLLDSGQVQAVDGEFSLRPGVRLMRVGGHTPGSQIVAVQTQEGLAVIAGDAIPLNRNFTDLVPNGILVNVVDAIAALKTVRALQPNLVFTHLLVEYAQRFGYP